MRKTLLIGTLGLLVLAATSAGQPADIIKDQVGPANALLHEAQAATTRPAGISAGELAGLRSELARLRAENAQLKAEITRLKAAQATASRSQEKTKEARDIQKAINEHRIVNGMTIEQANKSLSVKFRKESDSSDGAVYSAVAGWRQTPLRSVGGMTAGGDITGTEYTLEVKGGVVTNWSSKSYHADPGTARSVR